MLENFKKLDESSKDVELSEAKKRIKKSNADEANGLNIYLENCDKEKEQYYKDLKQELASNLKCL